MQPFTLSLSKGVLSLSKGGRFQGLEWFVQLGAGSLPRIELQLEAVSLFLDIKAVHG
ncbi:MAG: hypothetical protein VKJ46_05160 [Leptolyngbyaceae bacterium]|nr:hypothetical protein [Leptolyngbyaceae bacterium]